MICCFYNPGQFDIYLLVFRENRLHAVVYHLHPGGYGLHHNHHRAGQVRYITIMVGIHDNHHRAGQVRYITVMVGIHHNHHRAGQVRYNTLMVGIV